MVIVDIGNFKLEALVDSGVFGNCIDSRAANDLRLKITGPRASIRLASSYYNAEVTGFVCAKMNLESREYPSVRFGVMNNLCADIILGHEFMRNHKEVIFTFGGREKVLNISKKSCNMLPARVNKTPSISCSLIST